MGTNSFRPELGNSEKVVVDDINQYHEALSGNFVPRDNSGVPTNQGPSLGNEILRWGDLFVDNVELSGELSFQGVSDHAYPVNGVITDGPEISRYLASTYPTNNETTRSFTVKKGLKFVIDGKPYELLSDLEYSFPDGGGLYRAFETLKDIEGTRNKDYELELEGLTSAGYTDFDGTWPLHDQFKKVGNTVAVIVGFSLSQVSTYGGVARGGIALVKVLEVSSGVPTRFGHGQRFALRPFNTYSNSGESYFGLSPANEMLKDRSVAGYYLGQLIMHWIFIDTTKELKLTDIEPLYGKDSTARPSSPSNGQYFFDLSKSQWFKYNGTSWGVAKECFIGIVANSDFACKAVTESDPYKPFNSYNDISIDSIRSYNSGSARLVYPQSRVSYVSVFGENEQKILDTHWSDSSYPYVGGRGYLYVDPYGKLVADYSMPFYYPNRKGYYHRNLANYRCVGKQYRDSTTVYGATALPFAGEGYRKLRQWYHVPAAAFGGFARSSYDGVPTAIEFKVTEATIVQASNGVGEARFIKMIYHTGNPTTYGSRLEIKAKIRMNLTVQTHWSAHPTEITNVKFGIYLLRASLGETDYRLIQVSHEFGGLHREQCGVMLDLDVGDRIGFGAQTLAYNNKFAIGFTAFMEERG